MNQSIPQRLPGIKFEDDEPMLLIYIRYLKQQKLSYRVSYYKYFRELKVSYWYKMGCNDILITQRQHLI